MLGAEAVPFPPHEVAVARVRIGHNAPVVFEVAPPPVLALGIRLSFENPLRAVTRVTVPFACVGFLGFGAFFLLTEHRAHAFGWLPHMLLGLCVVLLYLNSRIEANRAGAGHGSSP